MASFWIWFTGRGQYLGEANTLTGAEWITLGTAALVAVVALARIIVKLTPTPDDDTFLEKIIAFLKIIGLHIPALLLVSLCGCTEPAPAAYAPRIVNLDANRFLVIPPQNAETITVTIAGEPARRVSSITIAAEILPPLPPGPGPNPGPNPNPGPGPTNELGRFAYTQAMQLVPAAGRAQQAKILQGSFLRTVNAIDRHDITTVVELMGFLMDDAEAVMGSAMELWTPWQNAVHAKLKTTYGRNATVVELRAACLEIEEALNTVR